MDVSVIIVNYNTSSLIADCVDTIIRKTTDIDYEVIVVDNNSEPDFENIISQKIPSSHKHLFRFVSLPENIGFGRANNEGIKFAKGRNILFLNPDTLLINNAIKILSDFLDHHPKAGGCGGNIFDENLNPSFSHWHIYPGIPEDIDALLKYIPSKIIYRKKLNHNFTGKPIEVKFIIGADLMMKSSVLKTIGSFSPDFFMFAEETDLCLRARKKGFKIFNVPAAKIVHLESKSFQSSENFPSDKRIRLSENGRKTFLKRHHSKYYIAIEKLLYNLFLHSRIHLSKNPSKKNYYKRRLSFFKSVSLNM